MNHWYQLSSDDECTHPNSKPKHFRINAIEPIGVRETRTGYLFDYDELISNMKKKAEEHSRNLLQDVFHMIFIYLSNGSNIDRIIEKKKTLEHIRQILITMKSIYGFNNSPSSAECSAFTLGRIAEAFPHVALVLADMLDSSPGNLSIRFCVSAFDLGAEVNFHFKLNYFPSLIDTTDSKAQVALLLYNLCNSKSILNTSSNKNIVLAFMMSCRISGRFMDLRLAPADARKKFTEYIIKSVHIDADSLNVVWNRVIGENLIPINAQTRLTAFHERVLQEQPLNLFKWRLLLTGQKDL